MINCEAKLYVIVKNAISSICPNSGTVEQSIQPQFPYMSFSMMGNEEPQKLGDSSGKEKFADIMIQVDTYSTATMLEAMTIIGVVSDTMRLNGFKRSMMQKTSSKSPYRVTAKYRGTVEQTAPNDYKIYSN